MVISLVPNSAAICLLSRPEARIEEHTEGYPARISARDRPLALRSDKELMQGNVMSRNNQAARNLKIIIIGKDCRLKRERPLQAASEPASYWCRPGQRRVRMLWKSPRRMRTRRA